MIRVVVNGQPVDPQTPTPQKEEILGCEGMAPNGSGASRETRPTDDGSSSETRPNRDPAPVRFLL